MKRSLSRLIRANKLWKLLEIALADLTLCEKQGYIVDMGDWYHQKEDGCHVCLAGACLAQRHTAPSNWEHTSDRDLDSRIFAISDLRRGNVSGARWEMGWDGAVRDRVIVPYHENKEKWLRQITLLLKQLKEKDV